MGSFNIFASRTQQKIDLSSFNLLYQELAVESYLQSLDRFRFTTALPPLPLPLRTLHYDKDVEAADAIHQILALADSDTSNVPKILPILTSDSEPIYRVARQYKSKFGGPIQETLLINMPIDRASCPQGSWDQNVRDIQTRLSALTKFSFETDIPHNIAHFDVEICDDGRCFNPSREKFAPGDQLSKKYGDWAKVYYSAEMALQDLLRTSLDESFLDVRLELQKDVSDTFEQKAIVVGVLPCTIYCWARLRGRVLDLLQEFSSLAEGLVPPTFEVEFFPLYEIEASKMRKEIELRAIRHKAPDLLTCEDTASVDPQAANIPRGDGGLRATGLESDSHDLYDTPKVRSTFNHHLRFLSLSRGAISFQRGIYFVEMDSKMHLKRTVILIRIRENRIRRRGV